MKQRLMFRASLLSLLHNVFSVYDRYSTEKV